LTPRTRARISIEATRAATPFDSLQEERSVKKKAKKDEKKTPKKMK